MRSLRKPLNHYGRGILVKLHDIIALIAVLILGIAIGRMFGTGHTARSVVPAPTIIQSRKPPPITNQTYRPERIIEYRERVKTDTVTIEVPTVIREEFYLTSTSPVAVRTPLIWGKPEVRFTYYNPSTGGWETSIQKINRSPVTYGLELETGVALTALRADTGIRSSYAAVRAYAGYRGVEPFIGYQVTPDYAAPVVGLRVRFGR
jgi:hypothetical protein